MSYARRASMHTEFAHILAFTWPLNMVASTEGERWHTSVAAVYSACARSDSTAHCVDFDNFIVESMRRGEYDWSSKRPR